jgi:hypothetical protein
MTCSTRAGARTSSVLRLKAAAWPGEQGDDLPVDQVDVFADFGQRGAVSFHVLKLPCASDGRTLLRRRRGVHAQAKR